MHTQHPKLPKDERAALALIHLFCDVREQFKKKNDVVGYAMSQIAINTAIKQLRENRRNTKI